MLSIWLTSPAFADATPKQQHLEQRLAINYSLAKAFEEKSQLAMSKAEALNKKKPGTVAAQIEFRNALLYALEAQRWPLPEEKKAISDRSLQRLLNIKKHAIMSEQYQTPRYEHNSEDPDIAVKKLNGHVAGSIYGGGVYKIAYSADGKYLASVAADESIRLWDVKTGKTIQTIKNGGYVSKLTYSPDGQRIATNFKKIYECGIHTQGNCLTP